MYDWNWEGSWGGWWGGLAMLLMMLAFWGGLIWIVIYAVRSFSHSEGEHPGGKSAREVLEERFARGEIDRDEFEERRRVLGTKVA